MKKAESGELKATLPVSGVSTPAREVSPVQSLSPTPKEEKNKEEKRGNKKSLGDVLSHLKQEYKGSEESKIETNKSGKSELKDLLGKIDNFAQKKPAVRSDLQTAYKKDAIQPDSFGVKEKTEAEEKAALLKDQEKIKNEIAETERKLQEKREEKNKILESEKTKTENSGVIGSNIKKPGLEQGEQKTEEEAKLPTSKAGPDFSKPYLSPESRLLFGKPEQYSSVSKKVKMKREGPEVSNIKKSLDRPDLKKEEKKINPEKEHRRFRKFMKGKYTAKIAEKKSKKIITSLLILMVIAITAVFVWFLILNKKSPEQPVQPIISVTEIEKFASVKGEIIINLEEENDTNAIAKIIFQTAQLERNGKLADVSRVILKEGEVVVSLERLLKELKIEIPKDTLILFNDNKYNLLLFKEATGVKRLGLAFVVDNPSVARLKFQAWESESIENRKIHRAFEPLFLGNRILAVPQTKFKTAEYLGVKMRYFQIPDQHTSLDYLIYDDILAVTTSKDSAFKVIEMLVE